jgi:hypothetical protein
MFVGADTGAPEPVMQTCDEDDQAAMENVLFGFGAAEEDADEAEDEEASEPADAPHPPVDARVHGPGRRGVDERRPLGG